MGKFIDKTGKKFGKLKVIARAENEEYWYPAGKRYLVRARYLCRCECGKELIRSSSTLKESSTCGERPCINKFKDFTGQTFGRWTVLNHHGFDKYATSTWKCLCSCGTEKVVASDLLSSGKSLSCGCYQREQTSLRQKNKPARNKLPSGQANFNGVFSRYKYQAKQRNLDWLLTEEQFKILTSDNCYLCGTPPKNKTHTAGKKVQNGYYIYNGIDRVDNKKGYFLENCKPCCSDCNYAKQETPLEEFLEHVQRICSFKKLKV